MATQDLKVRILGDASGIKKAMVAVQAAIAAAFVAAVKVTADFEKQLSKLEAVSGATAEEMVALEKNARELGKSTAYTASEVAQLQFELSKLGFTSKQILQSSGGILNLSAALGVELADAAVLAGSTIRSFGLDVAETGRVTDVLAKAASSSALDFSKLMEGLKDSAPIAKLYNVTIEETVAMLGQLANAGIHGTKAGNGLKRIFFELDKKGISLAEAMRQVRDSSNPAATALELVGKIAAPVLAVLSGAEVETKKLAEALYEAEGAAEAMRLKMEDNLIGDFDKLKSAVTELGISVGQTTDGPLRDIVQWMTDFINGTEQTLGFLDSLNRAWLYLYETMLLAGRAAEMAWIAIQVNNPFGDGMVSPESLARLQEFNDELAKVNERIIDLSGGFITNTGSGGGGSTSTKRSPKRTKNTVGAGGSGRAPVSTVNEITAQGVQLDENTFRAVFDQAEYDKIIEANNMLADSFTSLGGSISRSLENSMGVFGAFVGAAIQGLTKYIAAHIAANAKIIALKKASASADAIKSATEAASSIPGVGAFLLPALIASALAVVGGAFSKIGGGGASGGGGGSVSGSVARQPIRVNSQTDTGNNLVGEVRIKGQDLILAIENANYSRRGYLPA